MQDDLLRLHRWFDQIVGVSCCDPLGRIEIAREVTHMAFKQRLVTAKSL